MTQLLISVKNVAEALIAHEVGVDIVDLKDPSVGALGALSMHETKQIVQALNDRNHLSTNATNLTLVSATVGEQHIDLNSLIENIQARHALGVDIIKIAVSKLFYAEHFVHKMQLLTRSGIQLVAVFFADEPIDLALLVTLKKIGFFGAMLDTQIKQHNLLQVQTANDIQMFTQKCHENDLQSGLAGSLQAQHITDLVQFNPTYIGFRGGACENLARENNLCRAKVMEIKNRCRHATKLVRKRKKPSAWRCIDNVV